MKGRPKRISLGILSFLFPIFILFWLVADNSCHISHRWVLELISQREATFYQGGVSSQVLKFSIDDQVFIEASSKVLPLSAVVGMLLFLYPSTSDNIYSFQLLLRETILCILMR